MRDREEGLRHNDAEAADHAVQHPYIDKNPREITMPDRMAQPGDVSSPTDIEGKGPEWELPLEEQLRSCCESLRAAGFDGDDRWDRWTLAGVFDVSGTLTDAIAGDIIGPGRLVVMVRQQPDAGMVAQQKEDRDAPAVHIGAQVVAIRFASRHSEPELWMLRAL